jgi:glutamate formiminotransferase/formiminotetrahydrofolate cyclodeaminase
MGLSDLSPFEPQKRIIEYLLAGHFNAKSLLKQSLREFSNETASESPAPGGGSISAYVGALGASLGTMVANLSAAKRGWSERWEEFSAWAEKGQHYKDELLRLVDEDTRAFNRIVASNGLPKTNEAEVKTRNEAIQAATKYAIEVPFKVMEKALASMDVIKAMAETGNPNSASDAGVGALCARAAVSGAFLNVKINAPFLDDKDFVKSILAKGKKIEENAIAMEANILKAVEGNIGK